MNGADLIKQPLDLSKIDDVKDAKKTIRHQAAVKAKNAIAGQLSIIFLEELA